MSNSDLFNIRDEILSPAEIQSICFKNDDINICIEELIQEQEKNIGRIKINNNWIYSLKNKKFL